MVSPVLLPSPQTGPRANNVNYLGAARCRRKFELYYPEGFCDETYQITERSYKERAHLEWKHELGPVTFRQLLARGEFREIADTAVRIQSHTNLLFSFEKMALRDAVKTPAGARLFATELYAFLWGTGSPRRRFDNWVQALAELPRRDARVVTWPLITVFGFVARPDKHLYLKPRVTRKAARDYGFDFDYVPQPSWEVYRSLLTFAAIIRRDLDRKPGFKVRDMIDVQSFIWVQGSPQYEA
ncbi:hypothetical protein [Caenimonas koreensis]|uniref:Uncharacterized protein n=1 Tax=Caenimonas koreensis DSM 17982 TaxID=1121255 RepID=A0A844ARJ6_9BURK|nr:hypothetical protein [Caenimonas koreensis]MRD46684.1 hypothetical protein [Caenimonas koreensis DSM 17982]